MRDYEVVYILRPSLTEEEAAAKLAKFHALVTRSEDSEVVAVDHWGARQLAYQIKGEKHGHYVVAQFKAEPADLGEFERILKLDDDVLRYLVVLGEGEPTSGMSIVAESPMPAGKPESEDEDEDEEAGTEGDKAGDGEERAGDFAKGATSPPEFSGGRGRRRRIDGPRIEILNYKDVGTLSRFITEQGKILPKRTTKVTAQFQRRLGRAVKRARYLALLPYIQDHDR